MPNEEYMNAFQVCSVRALMEDRSQIRLRKEQERKERIEDAAEASRRSTMPMVEELKALVESLQEQNRILKAQIEEAKKDSEEAKKAAMKANAEAEKANTEAKKEAKRARVFSWVSFGVATAISIAALVVSIIALF